MAVFGVGRGRARDKEAVPGPVVLAPRRSLDGWTLDGTPLAFRFAREELRELATLMHGVSAGMETPYTYERAADLLEKGGERPQALAVLDAYFTLPPHIRDANPSETRTLGRRRQRLRKRLGTPPPDAPTPDLETPQEQPALPAAPAPAPEFTRGILTPDPEPEPPAPTQPSPPDDAPAPRPPKPTTPPPPPTNPPPTPPVIPPRPTRPATPTAPPEGRR